MSSSNPVTRVRNDALEKLKLEVAPETEAIRAALAIEERGFYDGTVEAGRWLSQVREKLRNRHGLWLPWLEGSFSMTVTSARRYMRLFELSKCYKLQHLKICRSALYDLTANGTPDHVCDDIMRRAEAGEKFSLADVATEIASAKAHLRAQAQSEPADNVTSLAEKQNEQADAEARAVNVQFTSGVVHLMAPVTFAPVADGTVVRPVYTSPEDSAARRLVDAIEAYGAALTHGKKSALQRAAAGRDKAAIRRCLDIIMAAVGDDGA